MSQQTLFNMSTKRNLLCLGLVSALMLQLVLADIDSFEGIDSDAPYTKPCPSNLAICMTFCAEALRIPRTDCENGEFCCTLV
ncbi:uncharacterized protein Dvir_GJ26256 [Drosophila virilis]|uniref:WAP domain-containing protein n=1 Tax=Drosophila virilis TaxID=7244 RepID=A0A0Q9WET2_DROVI|nr:uncharacterized protein Dvir_GJ26256 [Drosophila virilis]